jgi:hypothetical protein
MPAAARTVGQPDRQDQRRGTERFGGAVRWPDGSADDYGRAKRSTVIGTLVAGGVGLLLLLILAAPATIRVRRRSAPLW